MRELVKVNDDFYQVKFRRMQLTKEKTEWEKNQVEKDLERCKSLIVLMKSASLYNRNTMSM